MTTNPSRKAKELNALVFHGEFYNLAQCLNAFTQVLVNTLTTNGEGALAPSPHNRAPINSPRAQDNQGNLLSPGGKNLYPKKTKQPWNDGYEEATSTLYKEVYEDLNSEFKDPAKFRSKPPYLNKKYNDTLDPTILFTNYCATMNLQGATDNILCKAFSTTLEKGVRCQYNRFYYGFSYSFPNIAMTGSSCSRRARAQRETVHPSLKGSRLPASRFEFLKHFNKENSRLRCAPQIQFSLSWSTWWGTLRFTIPLKLLELFEWFDKYIRIWTHFQEPKIQEGEGIGW